MSASILDDNIRNVQTGNCCNYVKRVTLTALGDRLTNKQAQFITMQSQMDEPVLVNPDPNFRLFCQHVKIWHFR